MYGEKFMLDEIQNLVDRGFKITFAPIEKRSHRKGFKKETLKYSCAIQNDTNCIVVGRASTLEESVKDALQNLDSLTKTISKLLS